MKKHLCNPCDKEWRVWLEIRREDGTYYEISQSVLAPSEEKAKALIKAVYSDVEIHYLFTKEIKEDKTNGL